MTRRPAAAVAMAPGDCSDRPTLTGTIFLSASPIGTCHLKMKVILAGPLLEGPTKELVN